jgi:cytochrome c
MDSTPAVYAKLLGLFAVLLVVVGFNLVVWGLHRQPTPAVLHVPGASPQRGRVLIRQYGCGACHTVPGVRGATGQVGPRLDRMRMQVYVAGFLPNSAQNLTFWISHPKEAHPQTAMPDLGINDRDARDIAAYLYDLP